MIQAPSSCYFLSLEEDLNRHTETKCGQHLLSFCTSCHFVELLRQYPHQPSTTVSSFIATQAGLTRRGSRELEQCFCSPTPPLAVLHACRESRSFLVESSCYTKSFVHETCPRYTWVNFAVDTIRTPAKDARLFRHEVSLIELLILDEEVFPAYTLLLNMSEIQTNAHIAFILQFIPLERLTVFVPQPFGAELVSWLHFMEDLDESLLRWYPPFDARIIDSTGREINFGNYRAIERDMGVWASPESDWGLDILNRASFPLFLQLPLDIRRRVWSYSMERREVYVVRGGSRWTTNSNDLVWVSPACLPAGLEICHESRAFLGSTCYTKAFTNQGRPPLYMGQF